MTLPLTDRAGIKRCILKAVAGAVFLAGLTFAFGEGGSKRVLAGVLFGVGMAIAAVNFLAWLFPGS